MRASLNGLAPGELFVHRNVANAVVGRQLAVHGWIYGLGDGRLHDVGFVATQLQDVERAYAQAVTQMSARPSA